MKSSKFLSALLFAALLVTFSCQKDDGISGGDQQENIPDTFSEYFGNDISRDFLGNVIDVNKNPIQGVTITIGNETATTDSNGVFIIRDADVKEQFGYVKAEKAGYIHGSRSVVPSEGTNKVTIMLLEATVVGSVNSGNSEIITDDDGSSVSFDGNFIKEDGSTYSGSVNVIMHHLDPTDENINEQMPGMLYAQNADGAERLLQTLGMLAVELRGAGGEDLNLAEGSTSEIRIPVDASLMNIAPATIPLWYFDEANGYWKEEGEATLQGNMYVGTVSHFSFWNVDIQEETTILCVNLINEDGNEISNMRVTISSTTFGTSSGITNNNGEVCGFVPSNETLTLNVFSNETCDNIILISQTIGPLSADSIIDVIVPNNPEVIEDIVTGNFLTCEGEPVSNGYVLLNYNDRVFLDLVYDGNFDISLYRCSTTTEFTLEGIDIENIQSSTEVAYSFTSPLTNVSDIVSCEDYQYSYVYFQIGNYQPISKISGMGSSESAFRCSLFTNPNTNSSNLKTGWEVYGTAYAIGFTARFTNFDGLGVYTNIQEDNNESSSSVNISSSEILNQLEPGYPNRNFTNNFVGTAEILSFGEVGEFIELNFLGTLDIYRGSYQSDDEELLQEDVLVQGYMRLIRKN